VPDENLGQWVMEQTGRPMTLWKGNCYAHVEFQREQVLAAKQQFPDAKIVVHPESLREVRDLADAVCSTEKMITLLQDESGEAVRHRDGVGHHPPDAEGMSGQGISLRADV
jgi:quinolinate synthase